MGLLSRKVSSDLPSRVEPAAVGGYAHGAVADGVTVFQDCSLDGFEAAVRPLLLVLLVLVVDTGEEGHGFEDAGLSIEEVY